MKRNDVMFFIMATTVAALTGCLPVAGSGSDGGTVTGSCPVEGDTMRCTNSFGCAGILSCGCPTTAGGCVPATLVWGLCTGPTSCAPDDAGTSGTDAGAIADAGMMSTDAGMPGTDAGMPGTDAGPPCDPTVVRTCMTACGVPGAIGFLLDSCDSTSPCVDDLTDPTGGCVLVPPTSCPPRGASGAFLIACHTVCGYTGIQTLADYCMGDECYPVFPESCMPMDAGMPATDAGMMSGSDAGMDAGPPPVVDAGMDAGTDAGMDAGPVVIDAGMDAGPPPVDAGMMSGDAGFCVGSMCVELDMSVAWCPSPRGGTLKFRNWDNTGDTAAETEHFDALTVPVPINSSTGIWLNGSPLNNTIWCSTGSTAWEGYFSPVLVGAAIGSRADAIGVRRITMDGVDVTPYVRICWDHSTSARDNTTALSFHRVQIMAQTGPWSGCYATTGP